MNILNSAAGSTAAGSIRALTSGRTGPTFNRYGILVLLVCVVILASVQSDFLSPTNLANIVEQWAPVALMAMAMTFCLIGGGFDLSVGATYALGATVSASVAQTQHAGVAMVVALMVGAGIGLANGLAVTKIKINPLIATLGMSLIVGGAALLISDGETYTTDSSLLSWLASGSIGPLPVPLLLLICTAVVATFVLTRTTYGQSLYATGGNESASYLSGIPVDRVRIWTYVITGIAAAAAGVLYVGRVGSGQANIGDGIELQVIAAALIGGVSLLGGEGAIWQALSGVALLAVLQNLFNQNSINAYWQSIVQGLIILFAVGVDAVSRGDLPATWRSRIRGLLAVTDSPAAGTARSRPTTTASGPQR
ncbi:ABC transporter permease [Gordonia sp. NPDC003376]